MQRALAIKISVIVLLIILLLIPLTMISDKIAERSNYEDFARNSIAKSWTGSQQVVGPILVIPYDREWQTETWSEKTKSMLIKDHKETLYEYVLPTQLNITANVETETRSRGIYKIPVYSSSLKFSGSFNLDDLEQAIKTVAEYKDTTNLGRFFLAVTVTDPRGINSIPELIWEGMKYPFKPDSKLASSDNGVHAVLPEYSEQWPSMFRAEIGGDAKFEFGLDLRGMESLMFTPTGKTSSVALSSSWPHPEFSGVFLPNTRQISDAGFNAKWQVTSFASNIEKKAADCAVGLCTNLFKSGFGVKLIEPVDIYLQSERSVKYGLLIISLTFVTFFIFEILKGLPIHAIQYTLVGLAIAIFYLLLISLSEHISFGLSYLIATLSCVGLMMFYLSYVLKGYRQAAIFSAMFLLLYGVLYVIIRAEDFSLLMGSILTFTVLAIVMFTTRHVNWYEIGGKVVRKGQELGQQHLVGDEPTDMAEV